MNHQSSKCHQHLRSKDQAEVGTTELAIQKKSSVSSLISWAPGAFEIYTIHINLRAPFSCKILIYQKTKIK